MPIRNFQRQFDAAVRDDSGCLIWQGYVQRGYARYSGEGAYREAYRVYVGPIPSGMTVDHTCFNPRCVEPSHLRLLTNLANARNHASLPVLVPDSECINGHEFTPENTYVRPSGNRDCRTCIRARVNAYRLRRAAA